MNLIEAFEKGKVKGIVGEPESEIESLISRLFFYGDRVYKIYKYDKAFFGDFGSFDFRKEFYAEDFYWNHAMSPDIYLELRGVKKAGDVYVDAPLEGAEDFYIVMKKVDDTQNLMNLLVEGKGVSDYSLVDIVHTLASKLRSLTGDKKGKLKHLFDRGWAHLFEEDLRDLRDWAYMAEEHIPRAKTDEIVGALAQASRAHPYFREHDPSRLSVSIDDHGGNILIIDGKIGFIDILNPKENWRVVDEIFDISRPATDVAVLLGREKADLMYDAYKKISKPFPDDIRLISDIHSAFVQAAYLHMLHKHALAERYMAFIKENLPRLV